MQYVADPGDFRNLAKNIQISNLQSPLFIAWLHAKEQYSYTLYIFYRSCDFDISISFSFFFRTTSSLHMLVISYENQRDHAMPLTRRLNLKYMLTNFGREYVR